MELIANFKASCMNLAACAACSNQDFEKRINFDAGFNTLNLAQALTKNNH